MLGQIGPKLGYVSIGARPNRRGFNFPQKVLLGYADVGLMDIAEVALNVIVVGLGGPAAKEFDGVVGNCLS